MSTSQRKRKQTRVIGSTHFVSPLAHHLEEAVVHLHAIVVDKNVSAKVRRIVHRMEKELGIIHRWELKRHGIDPDPAPRLPQTPAAKPRKPRGPASR
jgi:hypothetical protein